MASRGYIPPDGGHEGEQSAERLPSMQRGVSQLLFNYLPYRTVDWEDGLAIVQLGWSFALSESLRAGLRRTGEKMDIGRRAAKCVINVM